MNTNMTGLRCFSKIFAFKYFGRNSLSIGRVKVLSTMGGGGGVMAADAPLSSRLFSPFHACEPDQLQMLHFQAGAHFLSNPSFLSAQTLTWLFYVYPCY